MRVPVYILVMGMAAALGLAKLLLLSYLLPSDGFGYYATVAGIAGVLTAILSFGKIEGTIKSFPRLWSDGKTDVLIGQSKSLAVDITIGSAIAFFLCTALGFAAGGRDGIMIAALAGVLGYVSVGARAVSALNLCTGEAKLIQNFSLFRAAMTIALVIAGELIWGWRGAIAGEVVGAAGTVAFGLGAVRSRMDLAASPMPVSPDMPLYASSLLTNATLMGDRPIVAALAGPGVVGVYAFTMLIAQIGQVFVNIIGQKMGPTIIRKLRGDVSILPTVRYMGLALAATVGVVVAVFGVALAATHVPFAAALLAKYEAGIGHVALGCLIALTYFYVILEYAAIALDREKFVLAASGVSLVAFVMGAGVAYLADAGSMGYLISIASARGLQGLVLVVAIAHRSGKVATWVDQ